MKTTVMIATRNRGADLERTCHALIALRPPPDEVIICADACSDGTEDMIRQQFPLFRLIVNSEPKGSVPSRDLMLRQTRNEIVVSLDDDSYPLDADFFTRLPGLFEAHPEAAVITFPEIRDGGASAHPTKTPQTSGHYVSAYANCAAAMRRQVYLQASGFPRFFRHMYEEPDYALQCYGLGYAVWFEPSLRIRHHLSAVRRQPVRRHHQNARNELWSVWMRCPWPYLPLVSFFRVWRQLRYACSEGASWALREPVWWWQAATGVRFCFEQRRPLPWRIYFAWMGLARRPINNTATFRVAFGQFRDI